jgi:hypothetical protein
MFDVNSLRVDMGNPSLIDPLELEEAKKEYQSISKTSNLSLSDVDLQDVD